MPQQPPSGPPPGWPQDPPNLERPQAPQVPGQHHPPQPEYGPAPAQYPPQPNYAYPPPTQYPQPQGYGQMPQYPPPQGYAPPQPVEVIVPRVRASIPDFVQRALHPWEQVLGAFNASLFDHRRRGEFRHDKFLLTTERIIYYHTAIIHKGMGEMSYRTITGIQYNRGFRHGKVVVEAANVGLTMDGISNDDAAFAEKIIAGTIAGRRFQVAGR